MRSCEISRLTTIANIEVEENAEEDEEMAKSYMEKVFHRDSGINDEAIWRYPAWKNETEFLLSADCYRYLQEFGYETTRPFSADRKSKLQPSSLININSGRMRGGRQWESGKVGKWVETTSSIGPKEIRKSLTAVGHLLVLPPNKTVALPEEAEPLTKGKESLEKTRHSPTCYGRQWAASERRIVRKRRERNVVGRYTRRVTSNVWTCAWLEPEENSWDKRSRLDQLESKRAGRSATILVGTCREHV
ncbi:hypothetical protein HZH66_011096 [Vespula vulgaris]|uniref:Uncharacterized protein n=1 Tax=Vespula vulgaris TaxID=7454 RepID=A0A834MWW9_VESVU|nr:hypothetical protein HZH66_011096 [Vespula vulgaris]